MKEGSTAKDLVLEMKQARKRQGPRPPGFEGWIIITEPLDVGVTKGKFAKALEFIESLASEMPGFGISFSYQKGDAQPIGRTLGLTFLGQWLPMKIWEGYVEVKNSKSYEGTGSLGVEIGGQQRWIEVEHKGEWVTQIHSILTLVHVAGGDMFWQSCEDERAAKKLERERLAETELVHQHWVNRAVAKEAEEQAQSWQLATLIREYSAALQAKAQDDPKSIKWANWLGKYADRIDPLSRGLPEMPELKGPFNWDLQR